MKIVRRVSLFGLVTSAVVGVAAPAAFASQSPPRRTVASVQTHVDDRAKHITAKMQALQVRVAANKNINATAKAVVQADIAKVLNATTQWRKLIDAAASMTAVRAAAPAQHAVVVDLAQLRTDLIAAHQQKASVA
jgi:hypothetical protein